MAGELLLAAMALGADVKRLISTELSKHLGRYGCSNEAIQRLACSSSLGYKLRTYQLTQSQGDLVWACVSEEIEKGVLPSTIYHVRRGGALADNPTAGTIVITLERRDALASKRRQDSFLKAPNSKYSLAC